MSGAAGADDMAVGALNRYGRASELRLTAHARDGKTVVPELFCTQPFKVMHAFRVSQDELPGLRGGAAGAVADASTVAQVTPAGDTGDEMPVALADPASVTVMSVSAGIMAGDEQHISVNVETGAALQVTTQSFEKIHRMEDDGRASRSTVLHVGAGAYLDYAPLPQIPFAGSAFSSNTRIELADATSRLVFGEILSCGRVARGERFAYRSYRNRVDIRVAGVPVFIDNTVYEPEGGDFGGPVDMEGLGCYEGFTHLANLVLVNLDIDEERFANLRAFLREQTGVIGASAAPVSADSDGSAVDLANHDTVAGGITRLDSGDCLVKLLGYRAQRLQEVLAGVRALV